MAQNRPSISLTEARRLDLNSAELGVGTDALMANAGKALAREVAKRLRKGQPAIFFCGKGNNGGDGFAAAAELLAKGRSVWVVLAEPASRIRSSAAKAHFARLPKNQVARWRGRAEKSWRGAVRVDCLLGSGITGEPRAPYPSIIRFLNSQSKKRAMVLSCDVPSGFGSEIAVRPNITLALHAAKDGMDAENSGTIVVAPIGITKAAEQEIGIGDFDAGYIRPRADSHKGDNGIVLVVAGSIPLVGAAQYCALAAYRSGADLVHIATSAEAAKVLRSYGPEAIVHAACEGDVLREDAVATVVALLDRATCLLIGPGLGRADATRSATARILEEAAARNLPIVVDADGLDAVTPELLQRHGRRMVLTPHAAEFADLAKRPATPRNIVTFAREHGVTVLCKGRLGRGHADLVTDGERSRTSRRGHPTMTVGGTGDVLAGAVAELVAKGAPAFEAACAAAYLVGCAGEVAASMRSFGATATDVAEAIPSVLLRLPDRPAG